MSDPARPAPGSVGWLDLTIPDAEAVRDFYERVVGWRSEAVQMDGYADYSMCPPGGGPVAGVCHARGINAGLPACWLPYFVVADLDASLSAARAAGGAALGEARGEKGKGRFQLIRDPAGAHAMLYEGPA